MKNIEKFLEFNGRSISVLLADGTWWVALKPICEALGVDYVRQFKRAGEDEILSQLLSEQTMVAADGKLRKMVVLPERYVYGWLFSINSDSPALLEYKRKCYDVLFDYFHGAITGRMNALMERTDAQIEIHDLQKKLLESPEYKRILELRTKQKTINKTLKDLDNDLIHGQLSFDLE